MLLNRVNLIEKLKSLVDSWIHDNLVFSYNLTFLRSTAGPQIKLSQKQTSYSITITFQNSSKSLRVISFKLGETSDLERVCEPLYEAALIELVLQSLVILVFCAQHLNKDDVYFILSSQDAKHLSCLEELCTTNSHYMTVEGRRQILTLSVWTPNSDIFFEVVQTIKTQLYQQLWAQQKSDIFLRKFLQNPSRLPVPLLKNILTLEGQGLKAPKKPNILHFPQVFNL